MKQKHEQAMLIKPNKLQVYGREPAQEKWTQHGLLFFFNLLIIVIDCWLRKK